MNYSFVNMNKEYANEIAYNWKYDGEYSFYDMTSDEDEIMWIGLGLKPSLTGIGIGNEFVESGIEFGLKKFSYSKNYIMLAVASFNKRAIKLYENRGFRFIEKYSQSTNGRNYEFIKMKKMI